MQSYSNHDVVCILDTYQQRVNDNVLGYHYAVPPLFQRVLATMYLFFCVLGSTLGKHCNNLSAWLRLHTECLVNVRYLEMTQVPLFD